MTDPIQPDGNRIDSTPAARQPLPSSQDANANPSPAFRTLLDSLEKLVKEQERPAEEVGDVEDLADAMNRADDGFQQVMDLRRSLEEAFRRRMQ